VLAVQLGVLSDGPCWWSVLFAGAILAPLGLLDDRLNLPRGLRYGAHLCVAVATCYWLWSPKASGAAGLAIGLLLAIFITGLINSFNFMDGIDALVGSCGCLILAFIGLRADEALWLLLSAAYAGFLVFNLPPARVFMGDAGSTTLGAWVAIALWSEHEILGVADLAPLVPLIGDSAYTILRRLVRGENVLLAHHSHLYQRLLRSGLSHGRISAGYALATALAGLLGYALGRLGMLLVLVAWSLSTLAFEYYLSQKGVPFVRPRVLKS
jgi:UDP-N-acetylmuramyl pentapeptide phosphotransferase/UDP-N-acetylglucosamine-1-phosphate transferase